MVFVMAVDETLSPTQDEAAFIRQAHAVVRDLIPHRAWIYWCDFLGSMALAITGLWFYLSEPLFTPLSVAGFLAAGFLLYRASVFTHELSHMAPSRYRGFRLVWNILFGIPFLMPSFFYTDHRVHHVNQLYGTGGDAEYYPYAHMRPALLVLHLFVVFLIPFMLVARFSLLTMASVISPRARQWVWQKASSLGNMNSRYVRAPADEYERRARLWQETGCFLVVMTLTILSIAGIVPLLVLVKLYSLYVFVTFVNQLRVYAAHLYVNESEPMTFLEQMLDSTTIPGGPWSGLWAPLGMRYHALHHLFPTMPYHAMGRAHRRLMRELPADSPYHATVRPSLFAAVVDLFRAARSYQTRREVTPA
jgi:fatty acid desaturase